MNKTLLITSLETLGLTLLATALAFVGTHATEIDPVYGPAVGTVALGLVNLLNSYLNRPAEKVADKVVALAYKEGD